MSWLFKHLNLPRDAGAESDFERTDPSTCFAVPVPQEPFLKTLARQRRLLQSHSARKATWQPGHTHRRGSHVCWDYASLERSIPEAEELS